MHCETAAHADNWTNHPMFDLHPSFLEVEAAKKVFTKRLSVFADEVNCGAMRPETAMACALAEVWRQGRKYQRDQDGDALLALAGPMLKEDGMFCKYQSEWGVYPPLNLSKTASIPQFLIP